MTSYVVQHDGHAATTAELGPLAFAGYAHFTAMQVRDGRVRGLDLHLERLRKASAELFGSTVPDERLLAELRTAIAAGPSDLSLTAVVHSPEGEFTAAEPDTEPSVLIRTGPAAYGPEGPLALAAYPHERVLPQIKHVGEVAKTHYLRQAVAEGFDDAAFLDSRGHLSEASIWNLAFWDGTSVVWPEAAMLGGTTMAVVRRQLERLGVPQRTGPLALTDLPELSGAVVMNSWTPGVPVRRIADVPLPEAPAFVDLLHRAYGNEPLTTP